MRDAITTSKKSVSRPFRNPAMDAAAAGGLSKFDAGAHHAPAAPSLLSHWRSADACQLFDPYEIRWTWLRLSKAVPPDPAVTDTVSIGFVTVLLAYVIADDVGVDASPSILICPPFGTDVVSIASLMGCEDINRKFY